MHNDDDNAALPLENNDKINYRILYADRIRELEAQLAAEKKRRIYYQDIVYSVCNVLDIDDRHSGNVIVCGTAEEPCSDVETRIQQLTAERDSLRQQLVAAQERARVLNDDLYYACELAIAYAHSAKDQEWAAEIIKALTPPEQEATDDHK